MFCMDLVENSVVWTRIQRIEALKCECEPNGEGEEGGDSYFSKSSPPSLPPSLLHCPVFRMCSRDDAQADYAGRSVTEW